MILAPFWVPKDTSGPSFFELCFEHAKKDAKRVQIGAEPLGSLKGTQYRHPNQVQGTRTQYKVRAGARCEVQVRCAGAR